MGALLRRLGSLAEQGGVELAADVRDGGDHDVIAQGLSPVGAVQDVGLVQLYHVEIQVPPQIHAGVA